MEQPAPLLNVALWEPEVPPNTGNIARTCAALGIKLHLVGRLGFRIDDKAVRRAGLDYWPFVDLVHHLTADEFFASVPAERIVVVETGTPLRFSEVRYRPGDCLLFGNESSGLPASIRERFSARACHLPMPTGNVRSINLATTVGIVAYEAMRQLNNW